MGRAKEAADRIREEVPIVQVLVDYGYTVHPDGGDREQQFSCDLHGDGQDSKPSARVYPQSASFHCFACGRSRDAITLVRERDSVDFWAAVKVLESRYGLPALPWSGPTHEPKDRAIHKVTEALGSRGQTTEQILKRVERLIDTLCKERELPATQCAALWETHDRVVAYSQKPGNGEADCQQAASRVLAHVRESMGVEDAR